MEDGEETLVPSDKDVVVQTTSVGLWSYVAHFCYGKRFICYLVLSLGFLLCIALSLALYLTQKQTVQPTGTGITLKIYSLNNWAIPANADKESRLEALQVVLTNETFDLFLLQGLWMEYDHSAIQSLLPDHLSITGFRELGSSAICDGRITRAGCSGLSIVYNNALLSKVASSFDLYSYRGSIFTTDGTLGKGIGKLRLKSKQNVIIDVFNTHVHDSDLYYQDLQTTELMSQVFKSPADLVILGACLQSKPDEHPYATIVSYSVANTAKMFYPLKWSDPSLHGTFNMPGNHYTPKESQPSIVDYVFAGSPLKYEVSVNSFEDPKFPSISNQNISLSNHEPIGLTLQLSF